MRADGSSTVVLTTQRGTDGSDARWSPDGSRVAFQASGQLWVVNADGTDLRLLTQNLENSPVAGEFSWAPNGKRIVFARAHGGPNDQTFAPNLFTITTNGIPTLRPINYQPVRHFTTALQPTWSPDGRHIAFSDNAPFTGGAPDSIVVMRANGRHVHVLHFGHDPLWSPNSTWIAGRTCCGYALTMRADGTRRPTWLAGGATFSPGGSRLAYEGGAGSNQPNHNLYVANADGTHRIRVLHDPNLLLGGPGGPLWRGGTARG